MKLQATVVLAFALFATSSFAQMSSRTEMNLQDRYSANGFRVSLVRPILSVDFKAQFQGREVTFEENLDDTLGLSVGYASLPVQELGFTANAAYLQVREDSNTDTSILRVDGNLAYALSSMVNFKGGLNVSNLRVKDGGDRVQPGLGLQASAGFQFTRNFGLDVGYVVMNQKSSSNGIDFQYQESGPELSLNGTF